MQPTQIRSRSARRQGWRPAAHMNDAS
jgi:hypothetical protein